MAFANILAAGQIAGVKVDADAIAAQGVRRALTDLTGYEPANETVAAIENPSGERVAPPVVTAAIIASPDFQKR